MKKVLAVLGMAVLIGCSSAYYNTMEKFGVHKRDIMVSRVEEARDSQKDAEKQFTSALEQFKSVVAVDGGNIEPIYKKLNKEYEESKAAAQEIRDRIDSVESVSKALFKEWEEELKQYSSAQLRSESQRKLTATKAQYQRLITAMRKTESRLDPVLTAMNDQVLYLKHNLNARAIQSMRQEVVKIDKDVDVLLAAMRTSIAEAEAFIKEIKD
jgi:Skp family chaperone for outer membrane proteins